MKLAFIAPGFPYRGGISHFATRLANQLSSKHNCLYVNFTRLYPKLLFPGKTQLDTSESTLSFPSERVIDSIVPHTWNRAGRIIRHWGAEALVFHWWHPFFAPSYRFISSTVAKDTVCLCICHNVSPHEQSSLRRSAVKFGLKKMDGFVVHAKQEIEELNDLLPDSRSIKLFHPVYDIFPGENIARSEARARLKLDDKDRVVLYFGLIRPYKGVEVLLRAASKLGDVPHLKLMVVGEIYANRKEIMELLDALPEDMVRLVDRYIPNEEVSTWFRASDLVALPYISATQSGVVPVALRCNRPVVVTCVGGLPEVVEEGENGYLVEPNNPEDLASAIRGHFIERGNPDMSEGIERVRRRLSWERYAEELEEFLLELINN